MPVLLPPETEDHRLMPQEVTGDDPDLDLQEEVAVADYSLGLVTAN